MTITENISRPTAEASELELQLQREGRFLEAEAICREILLIQPDSAEMHKNLGNTLLSLNRLDEAEQAYRQSLSLDPDYGAAYNNLGNVLRLTNRLEEAEQAFHQALTRLPNSAEVHNNFGNVFMDLNQFEVAEQFYRKAIMLDANYTLAYSNRGNALMSLGRHQVAEKSYRQSITIKPNFSEAKFNLSLLCLVQGRFDEGFKLYEQRLDKSYTCSYSAKRLKEQFNDLKEHNRWEGESLEGKSVLIITEQGDGDNLMMMRYLPLLREFYPNRLIVYCDPNLKRLFQSMPSVDEVVSKTEPLPIDKINSYCATMSLPYLFQTQLHSIPNNIPYIFVPDQMKEKWLIQLGKVSGLKVGLVWAGSQSRYNSKRSLSLSEFSPLLDISGVNLISLQKGEAAGELKKSGWNIPDWMHMCDDYLDTASLVAELDLVISVDTSVAHLVGALGKPVLLLNRFESEWRWMLDREDSPWYPSMKILRQKKYGNWDDVIDSITKELTDSPEIRPHILARAL